MSWKSLCESACNFMPKCGHSSARFLNYLDAKQRQQMSRNSRWLHEEKYAKIGRHRSDADSNSAFSDSVSFAYSMKRCNALKTENLSGIFRSDRSFVWYKTKKMLVRHTLRNLSDKQYNPGISAKQNSIYIIEENFIHTFYMLRKC